jgi:hypothetical protein
MKIYTILAASLAIPMALASAQTTTPTTSPLPYIPLVGSSASGTNGSAGNSTWFIDTARNLVVMCMQSGGATSGTFTCTAQAVPTAATGGGSTGGGTTGGGSTGGGSTGGGTTGGGSTGGGSTGGGSTGGTGATGGAGGTSAGILRNPFSR